MIVYILYVIVYVKVLHTSSTQTFLALPQFMTGEVLERWYVNKLSQIITYTQVSRTVLPSSGNSFTEYIDTVIGKAS